VCVCVCVCVCMRVYAWTCVCAHACMHVCVRACTSLCACMCECRQKGFQVWTILKQPVSYELFPFDICINVWGHGTDGTKQEHCPKMHSHGSITNCWYTGVVVVVFTSWSLGITRYIQLYTDNCTLIKAFHRWVDCLCDRFLLPTTRAATHCLQWTYAHFWRVAVVINGAHHGC